MIEDVSDRRLDFAPIAARIIAQRKAAERQKWDDALAVVLPAVLAWLVIAFCGGVLLGALCAAVFV